MYESNDTYICTNPHQYQHLLCTIASGALSAGMPDEEAGVGAAGMP